MFYNKFLKNRGCVNTIKNSCDGVSLLSEVAGFTLKFTVGLWQDCAVYLCIFYIPICCKYVVTLYNIWKCVSCGFYKVLPTRFKLKILREHWQKEILQVSCCFHGTWSSWNELTCNSTGLRDDLALCVLFLRFTQNSCYSWVWHYVNYMYFKYTSCK